MLRLFGGFLKNDEISGGSRLMARNRIKSVLNCERVNISAQCLEMLREAMVKSLSEYMDIDEGGLVIDFDRANRNSKGKPKLILSVPVNTIKDVKK